MVRSLIKRGAIAGTMIVGLETAYALLRPSPYQPEFDPSGEFGDPDHPDLRVAVLGDSSVTAPGVAGPDEIWITIICDRLEAAGRTEWVREDCAALLDTSLYFIPADDAWHEHVGMVRWARWLLNRAHPGAV